MVAGIAVALVLMFPDSVLAGMDTYGLAPIGDRIGSCRCASTGS